VHVLHNRFVAPGAELADGCRNHVQAAPTAGDLEQVHCPVKHDCCPFDIALADMREGQIPQDDRLRLVTTVEATGGAFKDRPRLRAVTEGEIAGALYPSEPVGGEQAMGGIGGPHCLEMGLGGAKGDLTLPALSEYRVALADMQECETLQSMAPSRRGQRGCFLGLIAYQGGLTRTTRLRSMIRASVELLGTLPADHPSRATLEAHIGELVDVLVRRQRRRFEPFTRAGVSFGVNLTGAVVLLGGMGGLALEEIGVVHSTSEPKSPREMWAFIGFYTAVGLCLAFFAFRAWRRQRREHPTHPVDTPARQFEPITDIRVAIAFLATLAMFGLGGIVLMLMDPLPPPPGPWDWPFPQPFWWAPSVCLYACGGSVPRRKTTTRSRT
jgi:hypothetical protein